MTVTQTGVAACFSLDEYDRDVIKKHERTRQDKEDDRTRHLLALRAQTGPVFLIHRAAAAIDRVVAAGRRSHAAVRFHRAGRRAAHVWRVDARDRARRSSRRLPRVPTLYIADGHHRAASAARARQQLRGAGGERGRVGHVSRRGVSRVAGAHPSLQPLVTDLGDDDA